MTKKLTMGMGTLATGLMLLSGCATPMKVMVQGDAYFAEVKPAVTAEPGMSCSTVREAHDTRIAEQWPNTSYGDQPAAFAGAVGGAERNMLVRFDLDSVPQGARVVRATLRLHRLVPSDVPVEAHVITADWNEGTTWQSFGRAYASDVAYELSAHEMSPGPVSMDVTRTVGAWVSGKQANHGLLLRQTKANTAFATNEAANPEERPQLDVCWVQD